MQRTTKAPLQRGLPSVVGQSALTPPPERTNIMVLCSEELLYLVSLRRGTFASGQKYPKTGLETHGFQGHPSAVSRALCL